MSLVAPSVIPHSIAKRAQSPVSRKSLFRRLIDRIVAAQEARATAELKRHSHLLPRELDQAGWKLGERSESSLPFVR